MVIIVKFLVCTISENLLKAMSLMFETDIFGPCLVWILKWGGGMVPLPLWQLISGNCEGKNAPNQHYWSSLFKDVIKKFSKKILLDNNVTHLMQIFFLKKKGV